MIFVYVAGASKEIDRAREAMARVKRSSRLKLTHDWAEVMAKSEPDHLLTQEQKAHAAAEDIAGLARADLLWFLLPSAPSPGAWFELGYFARTLSVLGPHRRIVISGGYTSAPLFVAWAEHYQIAKSYQYDGDAFAAIESGEVQP